MAPVGTHDPPVATKHEKGTLAFFSLSDHLSTLIAQASFALNMPRLVAFEETHKRSHTRGLLSLQKPQTVCYQLSGVYKAFGTVIKRDPTPNRKHTSTWRIARVVCLWSSGLVHQGGPSSPTTTTPLSFTIPGCSCFRKPGPVTDPMLAFFPGYTPPPIPFSLQSSVPSPTQTLFPSCPLPVSQDKQRLQFVWAPAGVKRNE